MKQVIFAVAMCAAATGFAAVEWTAGTDVTVSEDTIVTETEYAAVNACASVTIAEGAKLSFQTKAPPTVTLKGTGTIVKDTTEPWTLVTKQSEFLGNWDLTSGVTTNTIANPFGSISGAQVRSIYVRDGATFVNNFNNWHSWQYWLDLAGTGTAGQGAFVNTKAAESTTVLVSRIRLSGDALINSEGYFFIETQYPEPRVYPGLDLQGHTLTFTNQPTYFMGGNITITGKIRQAPGDSKKTGDVYFRGMTLRAAAGTDSALVLGNRTRVSLYNEVVPVYIPIRVEDGATVSLAHEHQNASECPQNPGKQNDFMGGIYVGEGATVNIGCGYNSWQSKDGVKIYGGAYDAQHVYVSGPITGPGNVTYSCNVGSGGRDGGTVHILCPTNGYTGTTRFRVSDWVDSTLSHARLFDVPYSNAIPNYAKTTIEGGAWTSKYSNVEWGWSMDAVARFVRDVKYEDGAVATVVDISDLPGKTYDLKMGDGNGTMRELYKFAGAAADDQTVRVVGPFDRLFVPCVGSRDVTVAIAEGEKLVLTNQVYKSSGTVYDNGVSATGTLNVSGGEVEFLSEPKTAFALSGLSGLRRLVFGEGTLVKRTLQTQETKYAAVSDRGISIGYNSWGYNGPGEVVMESGSVVTSKFLVGRAAGAQARVRVKEGAKLTLEGALDSGTSETYGFNVGYSGFSAGTFDTAGDVTVLGVSSFGYTGIGTIRQRGGTWNITKHPASLKDASYAWVNAPYQGDGMAQMLFSGGTAKWEGNILLARGASSNPVSFTVSGAGTVFEATAALNHGYSTTPTLINFNDGGTFTGSILARYTNTEVGESARRVWLNFNGGRYRARGSGAVIRGGHGAKEAPLLTGWTIYEKGMTLDVQNKTMYVTQPIRGATGYGIKAVPYTTDADPNVTPYVKITGGSGQGASAFADVDEETGCVTNVIVTSRGYGYQEGENPIATIYAGVTAGADGHKWTTVECELQANTDGGMTLEGTTGELWLQDTNTWVGATILKGGTLVVDCDEALPIESRVMFAGGHFRISAGKKLKGGYTQPLKWGVDAAYAAAQDGGVINTNDIAFLTGSTFEVTNIDQLSEEQKNATLLTLTGTITGTKPKLAASSDPHYTYSWSGNTIKLKRLYGTVITIR